MKGWLYVELHVMAETNFAFSILLLSLISMPFWGGLGMRLVDFIHTQLMSMVLLLKLIMMLHSVYSVYSISTCTLPI